MFRKNYFTLLLITVFFLASGITVFAQNASVLGRVELTKADGSKAPVSGALVEIFRLDQRVKMPTDKTDKRGNFSFAGVPLGGKYVLAVSGPGIAPAILPNISAGMDNIVIPVNEGDGKRWTEEEVKQSVSSRTTTTTTTTPTVSEDDKKREEEIKKQNEAVLAENEKIKKANEIINASQKEGNAAYKAGNYDLAITKYEEGYNAAPTFAPTAVFFLNNASVSYLERANAKYKTLTKDNKASILEAAKPDWEKAAEYSAKAIEIIKTATPKDEKQKTEFEARRLEAIKLRKESLSLLVRTGADRSRSNEAIEAFQAYLAVEISPTEKIKEQLILAGMLADINESDQALAEYEKVLAAAPTNIDALAGAGFTLINIGYNNGEDKTKFQLGANYLQKFVDLAPDTHRDKAAAKETIETLKKSYKITPQKIK